MKFDIRMELFFYPYFSTRLYTHIPNYYLSYYLFKETADVNNNLHVSIRVEPKYK